MLRTLPKDDSKSCHWTLLSSPIQIIHLPAALPVCRPRLRTDFLPVYAHKLVQAGPEYLRVLDIALRPDRSDNAVHLRGHADTVSPQIRARVEFAVFIVLLERYATPAPAHQSLLLFLLLFVHVFARNPIICADLCQLDTIFGYSRKNIRFYKYLLTLYPFCV